MIIALPEAVVLIQSGEVIAAPTEAVYGLSADPRNHSALQRVLTLKQRPASKGFILLASHRDQLAHWVDWSQLPPLRRKAIHATWPGPVTWILPACSDVPALLRGIHHTIAVRITAHPVMATLCNQLHTAVISTSANLAELPPARSHQQLHHYFGENLPVLAGALGNLDQPTPIMDGLTGLRLR